MFDRTQDEAPAQGLWSVLQKAQALWAHHDWYRGADLGFRWRSGKAQGEICIRIHLRHKRPRDLVLASALLPAELDGIAIDVLEASYCPAPLSRQETPSSAANPYTLGGLACCRNAPWAGHGQITLLACCKTSGKPGLLSSWQALAGAKAEVNDPISRPGKDATGFDPREAIARLSRWQLGPAGEADFAELNPDHPWLPLQEGGLQAIDAVRSAVLGEVLDLRTTSGSRLRARVDGIGSYRTTYEVQPGRTGFRDISGVRLVPLAPLTETDHCQGALAETGGAWLTPDGKQAVGLHFAQGNVSGQEGSGPNSGGTPCFLACDLPQVFDSLNLRLANFADLIAQNTPNQTLAQRTMAELDFNQSPQPAEGPQEEDKIRPLPGCRPQPRPDTLRSDSGELVQLQSIAFDQRRQRPKG